MTDIEQQARELLAAECEKVGFTEAADRVRIADFTGDAGVGYEIAIQAIAAALASQPQAPAAAVSEDLRRDAERYRWLRNESSVATDSHPVVAAATPCCVPCLFGIGLDEAIDEPMRGEEGR